LAFGALVIVDGKEWIQQSILLEEAQAAQETMAKFYSRPGDRKVVKVKPKEQSLAEKLAALREKNLAKKKMNDSDNSSDGSNCEGDEKSTKICGPPVVLPPKVMKAFLPQTEPDTLTPLPVTSADTTPKKAVKKGKGAAKNPTQHAPAEKAATGAVAKGGAPAKGGVVPKPPAGKPRKKTAIMGKLKLQVVQPKAGAEEANPETEAEADPDTKEVTVVREIKPVVYSYYHDEEKEDGADEDRQKRGVAGDREADVEDREEEGESKRPIVATSAKVVAAAGVFASKGDRKGGRSGHLLGGDQPKFTKEQREAKDLALQMLQLSKSTTDTIIPEVFQPDFSSAQYSSDFTRSVLLHWQISMHEKGGTPELKRNTSPLETSLDKAETPSADIGEGMGAIAREETKQVTIMEAHAPVGVSQRSILSANQLRFRPLAATVSPASVPAMPAYNYANGVIPVFPVVEALSNTVSPFMMRRRRKSNGPYA